MDGGGEGRLKKAERVLYKTARDITSNIRKTDSPAAAASLPPLPGKPLPRNPQPTAGNEVVSILASGNNPARCVGTSAIAM